MSFTFPEEKGREKRRKDSGITILLFVNGALRLAVANGAQAAVPS